MLGPTLADLPPEPLFTSTTVDPGWIVQYPTHWNADMVERLRTELQRSIDDGGTVLMVPDGAYAHRIGNEPLIAPATVGTVSTPTTGIAAMSLLALLLSVAAVVLELAR